jgi:PAS domain S-box-containing protein
MSEPSSEPRSPDDLRVGDLQRRLDEFETLLKLLPVGVFIAHDPACRYITANPAGAAMLGLPAHANVSMTAPGVDRYAFRLLRDGVEVPADDLPMQRAARTRTPVLAEELEVVREDGSSLVLYEYATPLFDRDGSVRGCLGVVTDITLRRREEEAKAFLAAIVESSSDAILGKSLDGVIYSWNSGAERLFGYRAAEIIGRSIELIVPPEKWEEERALLERLRRGEPVEHYETVRLGQDGRRIDVSLTISPVRNGAGQIIAASSVARDITAQRRVERALRRQNDQLKVLSETAGYLLTVENPDAMLRGLFEHIREQLEIDAYFYFVVEDSGEALVLASCAGIGQDAVGGIQRIPIGQSVCGDVALNRRPVVASHIQDSADPRLRLVKSLGIRSYVCNPLIAGSRLVGTLSFGSRSKDRFEDHELEFMRTLCHYVAAAGERVSLISGLRAADRRKDEFLATLAHELRNPLAPIVHGLGVIRMVCEERPAAVLAYQMMERQVNHLVCLVNDLLEISRITRGTIALRRRPVDLGSIIDSAIETSTPLIEAAGHRFELRMPPGPVTLDADPVRLAQVIANLLNNAAKYTEPGGDILLSARLEGAEVAIAVRDSGVGIPPDMLARIFEMFTQVDRSLKSSQDGLGIGLTLARGLVQMHGGRIEARSDGPGRGSEFTVRLPALATGAKTGEQPPEQPGRQQAARRRILVVDDNVDAAESLGMLLELLGHEVQVLTSGASVRESARAYRPDFILLDIGLPGMDGFEVAEQLRADPVFDEVFLVAMTGYGCEEDRRRSREAGFDRHLVKPVSLELLEQLLAAPELGDTVRVRPAVAPAPA